MNRRFSILLIVIILLIAIPAIILANSDSEEEEIIMSENITIPLIDTMKPDVIETATFALG